jgi:hypothetical protein
MRSGFYLVAAAMIALTAFAIGQAYSGMGAPFAILALTLWAAWSARRAKLAR